MTGLNDVTSSGQTPMDDDDLEDLIPSHVVTRADLDEAELRNLVRANDWLRQQQFSTHQVLDDLWLRRLHKRMFGDVWRWAGEYRPRQTNIGVSPGAIGPSTRALVLDTNAWINADSLTPAQVAVRFHHGLVLIHPFRNGNGRHARLAADVLLRAMGGSALSWGALGSSDTNDLRDRYLAALRCADNGDFAELEEFALG